MEKKIQYRTVRILQVVLLLFWLVLISSWMFSGISAKYATGTSSKEQARVAAFDVSDGGTLSKQLAVEAQPGDSTSQVFQIVNKSEVAVRYTVSLEKNTNNILPLTFTLDGKAPTKENDTLVFTSEQLPGKSENDSELKITWPEDKEGEDSNLQYIGMVDYITIKVTATQID